MVLATLAALTLSAAAPSFDCAKANSIEQVVCAEPRLAALDARLADLYARTLRAAPTDLRTTRETQRTWLRKRDEACATLTSASAPCLDGYYRNRIDDLRQGQRRRDETAGDPAASADYAAFVGRWRVVGVRASDDAGEVTDFGSDEPRYMRLELSAEPDTVRWLNGTQDNGATQVCHAPSFAPRGVKAPLAAAWKAVRLECRGGASAEEPPLELTLWSRNVAELAWEDGALLHLRRMPPNARTPPPPHTAAIPPAPPGGRRQGAADKAYLLALQAAVRRRDREWFAAQGVISVNRAKGASHAYRPDEIREVYDWVITPDVERAVLAQKPDRLFRNWRGAMVGNGEVWFEQVLNGKRWTYAILAINQTSQRQGR